MKVSLKFCDDQRPLARAKIPISIIGIPFIAGASTGNHHDLSLDVTTAFESGPAFRVSYRPNEPSNPFSLAVKTGIGAFGSPVATPMSMITEFNLLSSRGGSGCPAFTVIFKPRLGDFCIRKTASSPSPLPVLSRKIIPNDEMFPPSPSPVPFVNGTLPNGNVNGIVLDFPACQGGIRGLVTDFEVTARSTLPITSRSEVGFRWGFRMPAGLRPSLSTGTFSMASLPKLVLNKVSITLIPAAARAKTLEVSGPIVSACEVVEDCKSIRSDIAGLQAENKALRKTVEDIRDSINGRSFVARKSSPSMGNKSSSNNEVAKAGWRSSMQEPVKRERQNDAKSAPEDVNEELKEALMGAHSSGK